MRALIASMLVLSACASGGALVGPSESLAFRVLEEGQNAGSCVEPPEFRVAVSEDGWIDLYDVHTSCQLGDVELPPVDFSRRIAVGAWWRTEGCLGFDVTTGSVTLRGETVVVEATSSGPGPDEMCATALGTLESLLTIERPASFTAVEFVLDGEVAGTATA